MSDHYVPGPNAHIDTSWLTKQMEVLSEGARARDLDDMEIEGKIYGIIESALHMKPNEPSPEAVVCRFLDVQKFLWFVTGKSVHFGRVDGFDDPFDCAVPEDYNYAVESFYMSRDCPPVGWGMLADDMRTDWLISCWTLINSSYDDYLLWHRYAGGPRGIGITIPYGTLKTALLQGLSEVDDTLSSVSEAHYGLVAYGSPLGMIPFNKRAMFENEKEVRFVAKKDYGQSVVIDVSSIFSEFRLRFSPDVPRFHRSSIESVWREFGGTDDSVVAK